MNDLLPGHFRPISSRQYRKPVCEPRRKHVVATPTGIRKRNSRYRGLSLLVSGKHPAMDVRVIATTYCTVRTSTEQISAISDISRQRVTAPRNTPWDPILWPCLLVGPARTISLDHLHTRTQSPVLLRPALQAITVLIPIFRPAPAPQLVQQPTDLPSNMGVVPQ